MCQIHLRRGFRPWFHWWAHSTLPDYACSRWGSRYQYHCSYSSPFDSFGVSLLSAHSVPRPLNITPDQFSVFPTVSAVLFVSSFSIAHQHAPACRARDLHVEFLSVCSVPVFLCRFDCTYRHSSFYRATLCVSAVFAVAHSTPLHTVRLPRWWIVSRWLKKSSNFLFCLVAHHSIFFDPSADTQFRG